MSDQVSSSEAQDDLIGKASQDQARASNPRASAWVSANAGSGKTHVLVNRVIRLMLTGTPPERILCLTYTKAAAAEMSNRLYQRLAEWIPLDDDRLIEKIHQNTGHTRFGKDELAEPRKLFARALETPGGLKIQTIHAFCEQLLHRFPIEAGITSDFKVMEDREADDLLAKVRHDFFVSVERSGDSTIRQSLADVIKYSGGQKEFDVLLSLLLSRRDELRQAYENITLVSERLAVAHGITIEDTADSIRAQAADGLDLLALKQAQQVLATRTANTDINQGLLISQILETKQAETLFELLGNLTRTGGGKRKADSSLCTKNCRRDHPAVFDALVAEAERYEKLLDRIKAVHITRATIAALRIGKIINEHYDIEKKRLGRFDYHDLIAKVLAMFAEMPNAAWVLYKLDGGLDHILIDEAQDTSAAQWDIIQFLADDFFTGSGARQEIPRSVFAVGDRKQSIYSFQGAVPAEFDHRKSYFKQLVEQSHHRFEDVDFHVSFRSTEQVLDLVDAVFSQPLAANGVGNTVHSAQRKNHPGLVELWPIEEMPPTETVSVWQPGAQETNNSRPRIRLATKIAAKIKHWLISGEILHSKGRPIRPGDILILVRTRTEMMDALVRALKLQDIPVAGVDRLKLTEHVGVQDLLALARFVLLPRDDLNFAGLLKSSLLAKDDGSPFNDDDLIHIAAQRGKKSVWDSFHQALSDGADYKNAAEWLRRCVTCAGDLLPFEFFSTVLSRDKKRHAMLRRLGSEAGEPLDAFLLATQEFERSNTPTLQGFLTWIESGKNEIKREMEKSDNEVRIMTIHGAKGLEADVVIVPDAYPVPDAKNIPKILDIDPQTPVWRLKKDFETDLVAALKDRHKEEVLQEYNRLLYVAMTRAGDRLYVAGAGAREKIKDFSWYKLIANKLNNPQYEKSDETFGTVYRIQAPGDRAADVSTQEHSPLQDEVKIPDWAYEIPHYRTQGHNRIAPSHLGVEIAMRPEQSLSPLSGSLDNRFLRGNLIHRLLQHLPEIPAQNQIKTAKDYLAKYGSDLSEQERQETLAEVHALLTHEKFASLFAPGSLAEVPVVAKISIGQGEEFILNGQIDRMCVSEQEILIVDYKTNKPPPKSPAAVSEQYITQLAAYRRALLDIYPDRKIQAALLWTHNATLMEIDEHILTTVFAP